MIWILFLLILVYQAVDIWQSYLIFLWGEVEANPILSAGINEQGLMFIVYFKGLFVLLLLLGIVIQNRKEKEKKYNGL